MDEFFSESKPDLINKKTLHNLEKMIAKPSKNIIESSNESWTSYLYYFYDKYVKHNMFFIIIIILLTIFLIYKYMTKGTDLEKFEEQENEEEEQNDRDDQENFENHDNLLNQTLINNSFSNNSPNDYQFEYIDTTQNNNNIYDNLNVGYKQNNGKRDLDMLAEMMFESTNDNAGMASEYVPFNTFG